MRFRKYVIESDEKLEFARKLVTDIPVLKFGKEHNMDDDYNEDSDVEKESGDLCFAGTSDFVESSAVPTHMKYLNSANGVGSKLDSVDSMDMPQLLIVFD